MQNDGHCVAQELLQQLLEFLKEPDYGLDQMNHIRTLAEQVVIYPLSLDRRTIKIIPHTCSGNALDHFVYKTNAVAQTCDIPPLYINGSLILVKPIVFVDEDCRDIRDIWITVHELCHLLSIGHYKMSDDGTRMIHHTAGLMTYIYETCRDSQVKIMTIAGDKKQNERFNDVVADHFMKRIFPKESLPQKSEILSNFQERIWNGCNQNETAFRVLIGQYFNGMPERIRENLPRI